MEAQKAEGRGPVVQFVVQPDERKTAVCRAVPPQVYATAGSPIEFHNRTREDIELEALPEIDPAQPATNTIPPNGSVAWRVRESARAGRYPYRARSRETGEAVEGASQPEIIIE